jgi:intein/homing endonuclease
MSEEIVIPPSEVVENVVENVIVKKPLSDARREQLVKAREAAQKKKKEIKEITTKSKSLKLEEAKLKAYQFDELMKKKEEIMNPPKEEIKEEIKEEVKEVKQPKKKRVIKKIIYEDDSEEEVEVLSVEKYKPHQQPQPQMNHETYTHLMYQNAYEKLQNKVNEERTKLLVQSLMPNQLFR